MATNPFGTVYGAQVQESADLDTRDVIFQNDYRVSTDFKSSHSNFVYNVANDTTEESTRITQKSDGLYSTGLVEMRVRDNAEMTLGVQVRAGIVEVEGADTIGTFTTEGLRFNNDDACIFFGENQEFCIRFISSTPSRLSFQYYNTASQSYVTKMSVLN